LREIDAMPAYELFEWMVYESIEPFGDRRRDFQFAQVMSLMLNLNRTKKSDKMWSPADVMPKWDAPPPKPQTREEQFQMMKLFQGFQEAQGNPEAKPS